MEHGGLAFELIAAGLDGNRGLLGALFGAGLIGGFAHCAGMCGPFVLTQAVTRLEAVSADRMRQFQRLTGAALAPYHLGRATTYAGIGAVAAAVAGGLDGVVGLNRISALLLALAALSFLGYALKRLAPTLPWPASGGPGRVWRRVEAVARPLFERPTGWRGYGLGLALGFLPCGLLYGAIAAAAATGAALAGGLAMIAFWAGTVPALVAVGLLGQVAAARWRGVFGHVASGLLMINAGALSYLAWRLIA